MLNGNHEKTLASVVAELKEEFKTFAGTRAAMLRSEMRDKVSAWKMAAPTIAIGLLLMGTAFLLLTGAAVAAIAVAFGDNPYARALALLIVAVAYLLFGGIAVFFAIRELSEKGLVPKRTLKVLQDDKIWMQNEARSQL